VTIHASWKSFGASVIGPSHVALGKVNQDSWASFHHIWGDGVVVSDGVGSKAMSDFGSKAACSAVEAAVHRLAVSFDADSNANLLEDIHNHWLTSVTPIDPREAAATCLFAFCIGDGVVRIGLLGDGCIAVVCGDGSVKLFFEDKETGFSNITNALSSTTTEDQWSLYQVVESECEAIILCTDGVSDDLEDVDGFFAGFVASHRNTSRLAAAARTRHMLDTWPVPGHSDDKTLACLLRQTFANE